MMTSRENDLLKAQAKGTQVRLSEARQSPNVARVTARSHF